MSNQANRWTQFLVTLCALLAIGTLTSYKSILSNDEIDLSFAPPSKVKHYADIQQPPPENHDAVLLDFNSNNDSDNVKVNVNVNDASDSTPDKAKKVTKAAGLGNGSRLQTKGRKATKAGNGATTVDETFEHEAVSLGNGLRLGSDQVARARSISIRIRDFRPLPPPPEVLAESGRRKPGIDFGAIATKWQLPAGSIELLETIQSRTVGFDYNPTTDILSLRHPLKTGGTSFSRMMLDIFGEGVIPGSAFSGWFNREKFMDGVRKNRNQPDYWENMRAFYTHSFLRPAKGGRKNNIFEDLQKSIPALNGKRFRLMTIVRRPLDLAASSFYETQCRIGTHGKQKNYGKKGVCPTVNLTDVKASLINSWVEKCKEPQENHVNRCEYYETNGYESTFEHCGSIDVLLEKGSVHNMLHKSLMGDFPRPPELGDNEEEIGINLTPTLKDVSLYTLRDLGGLIDYSTDVKSDFVWFAVTERFKESMCLFYYRFDVEPVKEHHALQKKCRPLQLWGEDHKQKFLDSEEFSYTVWRAANAILDVRMEDMRLEIKARLDAGEKLEEIPYLGEGCYGSNTTSS